MAIFSRCNRCGVVVVVAAACLYGAGHHQDICLDGRQDRHGMYCTKFVAEPVHGPHEDASTSSTVSTALSSIVVPQAEANPHFIGKFRPAKLYVSPALWAGSCQ